ncbi:hypothetical protein PR202_gb15883 [Eleusine coracana subsp. coracana]|uniref:Uncharacterized protein n=1 Tax=Eleusine coracana subsp. coracana TaxID=191504 RepID=A0AAV5EZ26_ELECO|nr:hypothetical protein PR202_gb15883 [Eleusine coracana subsp. coracana]
MGHDPEPESLQDDLQSFSQLLQSLCADAGPGEEDRTSMAQMVAIVATLRREMTLEAMLIVLWIKAN